MAEEPNEESPKDTMLLVLSLKSCFLKEDFEKTARSLISREETLKSERDQLKEENGILKEENGVLKEENGILLNQIVALSEKMKMMSDKLEEFEKVRALKRKADDLNSRDFSDNREISGTSVRIKSNTSLESNSGDKLETPQNSVDKLGKLEQKSPSGSSHTKGAESEWSKETRFSKNRGLKWENEDEMINCLIEDPYLCMEAVCVLYRLEIAQVKLGTKRPKGQKHRGLFGNDVLRGTKIAEFLTRGDPSAPAKRSIEELNEYDQSGMKYCLKLVQMYSRHLFEVHKSKEDQYFC